MTTRQQHRLPSRPLAKTIWIVAALGACSNEPDRPTSEEWSISVGRDAKAVRASQVVDCAANELELPVPTHWSNGGRPNQYPGTNGRFQYLASDQIETACGSPGPFCDNWPMFPTYEGYVGENHGMAKMSDADATRVARDICQASGTLVRLLRPDALEEGRIASLPERQGARPLGRAGAGGLEHRRCLAGAAKVVRSLRTGETVVALDEREVFIQSPETPRVCGTATLQVHQRLTNVRAAAVGGARWCFQGRARDRPS